jgi:hypothetical protein
MVKSERKIIRTVIHPRFQQASALVEDSLVLSINQVVGRSPTRQASIENFSLSWPQAVQFQGPVKGTVDLSDPAKASVFLEYELDGVLVNNRVQLVHTVQPFRWWFICPLKNLRVAKLYLPPGARRFASRKAHSLIYRCQVQPRRLTSSHLRIAQALRRRD